MRNLLKLAIASLLYCSIPTVSNAMGLEPMGFYFSPSFSINNEMVDSTDPIIGGSKQESNSTSYDIKVGYAIGGQFYVGGIYSGATTSDEDGDSTTSTAYGVSVGFFNKGFQITASYFLSAEIDLGNDSGYSGGSGFGVDLGYIFALSENIGLGPQLTYRSIEFTKLTILSNEFEPTIPTSETYPQVVFAFAF